MSEPTDILNHTDVTNWPDEMLWDKIHEVIDQRNAENEDRRIHLFHTPLTSSWVATIEVFYYNDLLSTEEAAQDVSIHRALARLAVAVLSGTWKAI